MLDLYKSVIARQYDAALCTLGGGVGRCPDAMWDSAVANLKFCQAVFHALIFTDLYLGPDVGSLREQGFHREHSGVFGDYEEFEPRRQAAVYTRPFIELYLGHCRAKAAAVTAGETAESLAGLSGFERLKFPRAELHVYNIRHVQHHAAQLSLRLRLDTGDGVAWVGSGWREL